VRKIPNFFALRAFEAAARHESFTLGAQELNLTPSAISHQVRELEEYFGIPLFVRGNRTVEATPEGLRLLESLTRVFDALEDSCSEVGLAARSQVLTVHCAPSLAVKWLGPRLPKFMQAHDDIAIRLSSGAEPLDLTRVREIDVAISYGIAREGAGIRVIPLGPERIVPMCSPKLAKKKVPPRQLVASLPLIDSQLSRVSWPDWFALNGLPVPAIARTSFDRGALAISAAADGMGIALESVRLAEREFARGELIEIGRDTFVPLARDTHFLSYRTKQGDVAKIATFRTWLLREAGIDPASIG
jgi:LysR family glycine cleavage system transcriptional activator